MSVPYNINDHTVNPFLNAPYITGALGPSPATRAAVQTGSTLRSVLTPYAKEIIEQTLTAYNTDNGTTYNHEDFGIARMNNDQNSICAYLVYPLLTTIPLILRVYLQLGLNTRTGFNFIKFVGSPVYSS